MIQLSNISKSYDNIQVLQPLNWQIEEGKSYAILGPSGSGKSTLLHLIAGLDTPTTGKIMLDKLVGKNHATWQDLKSKEIDQIHNEKFGFIYQFHHLLPEFSALENVIFPLKIAHKIPKKQQEDQAIQLLTELGLSHRLTHLPHQLSGGERQRVAIARALVHQPKIILADEPTGNLDYQNAQIVFNYLEKLTKQHGSTLIMVTHDESLVGHFDEHKRLLAGQLQ
jgi:lipoprotein-releasing system ATP-binding protein